MAGADGAFRRPFKKARRGSRRDDAVFVLLAVLAAFAIAAVGVSLLKAGVREAAQKNAQATQDFAQMAEAGPVITFMPEITEAMCGGTEPSTAVLMKDGLAEATMAPEPPVLWTEEDLEKMAQIVWAEARGVRTTKEQAAVVWTILNRLDAGEYGESLEAVMTAPHQFAWRESSPAPAEFVELARDVCTWWAAEKAGAEDVGRVLPSSYLFFEGDGVANHFRETYEKDGTEWGWTLPDPYEMEVQE